MERCAEAGWRCAASCGATPAGRPATIPFHDEDLRLEPKSPAARKGAPSLHGVSMALLALTALLAAGCVGDRFTASGWSGVSHADSSLLVGTRTGKVLALSPDGARRWEFPAGEEESAGAIYGRPAVANDLAYVAGYSGSVFALEKDTGQVAWRADVGGAVVGSPAVAAGRVVVPSSDGRLYAFDAGDGGEPLWTFPASGGLGKLWSSPTIHQGTVYFGSLNHRVYAVSLETGRSKWEFETGGAVTGKPLVLDGTVYVGSFDNSLYALDAANGEERARMGGEGWFWAGPVAGEGGQLLYAADLDGNLYAWDGTGTEPEWRFPVEARVVAPPLPLGPERIVLASDEGRVYLLDRNQRETLWTYPVGSPVRSPLASSGGVVYLTSLDGAVTALDVDGMQSIWTVEAGS